MKKMLCAALCAMLLLVSLSAGAEMVETITVEDPFYAFTAPDGTRTVTDLEGLAFSAQVALHEAETPVVSAQAQLQAMGEDALTVQLCMDNAETLARFNNMDGVLQLTGNTLLGEAPDLLRGSGFAMLDALRGAGMGMTEVGRETVTLDDGDHMGTVYLVSGTDESEGMLMLTVTESGAFLAQPLGNARYGIPECSLLWNVAEDGTGYAEFAINGGTYRYDGRKDDTYPDMLRGSIAFFNAEGEMDSERYACFAPEEREDGLRTVVYAAGSAWSAYAEFGDGTFFASAVPENGSVWSMRIAEGQFTFAAEKDGSRDFVRANTSYTYSEDASLLPVPDFSDLPIVTAENEQFVDVGLNLKAKLMRIDALQQMLDAWGVDESND